MKRFTQCFVVAFGLMLATTALAQSHYPDKPIRVVVGFVPGTSTDLLARIASTKMAELLGQSIIIENRPGAGSSIAASGVARATPDGYTLLASSSANTINPALYNLTFDLERDLVPIGAIGEAPLLVAVHPSVGAKNIAELVAISKAKPGTLAYGSSGVGTFIHLNGELFKLTTGADLRHVPYKGSSQAMADLLSGQIQAIFAPTSTAISHVKAGKVLALAITGRARAPALPDVPTLTEAGTPGQESALWTGLHAPAGTPVPILHRLNQELQRAIAAPDVLKQFEAQLNIALPGTSEQFAKTIREDIERWGRVVKTGGIKPE
ncbi:MAG: tripartite tricarboxylate transporter substrate binding protein [Burkholderiales bacterium]